MDIKRLCVEESPLACEVIRALKRPEKSLNFSVEVAHRLLARPENVFIVALSEGEPAGFALAYLLGRADRGRQMLCIYEIAVSERFRRRGVGRAMIDELKALCRQLGLTKAWTVTSRSNEAAVGLYRGTGARPGPGGDDVTMVRNPESWS